MMGVKGPSQAAANPALAGVEIGQGPATPLNENKDQKTASTAPAFGDVWKKMQAEYGVKAEKPREIKKTLGKDDFLRIMVTQMQHQDPTSPFKADQMAQQMAQYASVEQLQNMNSQLSKMTTQNQPLERLAMTGLIGKVVTVDKERFPHTEGNKDTLGFELPKDAAQVTVSVVNDAGETMFSKELGSLKKGSQSYVWEGIKANTLPAKSGSYVYKIDAKDGKGVDIAINPKGQARVVGVSFEGKEPLLLIGDPANPQKIAMSSVSRIDSDSPALLPGAQSLAAASGRPDPHETALSLARERMAARNGENIEAPASAMPPASPAAPAPSKMAAVPQAENGRSNFFGFRKGEGSESIDTSAISGDARRALQGYDSQRNQALAEAQTRALAEAESQAQGAPQASDPGKGFPNGLNQ